jgi:hypothetical protein
MDGDILELLRSQLAAAQERRQAALARNARPPLMQIPGLGKTISSAYEQLRNAAEYSDEHLLLQRAVRRFFIRAISFSARRKIGDVGEELIVELTQAGYLHNNSVSVATSEVVQQLVDDHLTMYRKLRSARVPRDRAAGWVLDLLSAETVELLEPRDHLAALAYVAYQHYVQLFPRDALAPSAKEAEQYEVSLYIATHQALLKSNLASLRQNLVRMYRQSPKDIQAFIAFNQEVDRLYSAQFTQRLKRAVSRYGAPWRILKTMCEERNDVPELLADRKEFLAVFYKTVIREYTEVKRRLNRGIIKSVVFLFITKMLVGLAIEIPYDIIFLGGIVVLPLVVNLLFPPLYMAALKLVLHKPSLDNADALRDYIDQALYGNEVTPKSAIRVAPKPISGAGKALYGVLFLLPFAITVYVLALLHFTVVQGVIFFVFLSTASFLGFRLSRMVRELELVVKPPSFITTVNNFFYLPFIMLGQWLSGRYARANVVGYVLDVMIELPLKTLLRLVRQWMRFVSDKHDEIS